ncbi:MAG: glycosyl hydrolase 115 family protein [Clostridiales bacterium]|nr:glycosyl hydrolase 115 family protein [Clostridiales bacterium]
MILVDDKGAMPFLVEETADEGIKRITRKVCEDVRSVAGILPECILCTGGKTEKQGVYVTTVGQSPVLDALESEGMFFSSDLFGLREVYRLGKVHIEGKESMVIAGSDKRGTIYGLFTLSRYIGVSPFVYWADAAPVHQDRIVLPDSFFTTSKEPSVRYRGFFINDEFPSFGNWAIEKFGGFTAELYEKVFELLLRLKGNYLWPAMWVSSFPLDGPGELSCELADQYGIIMGNSHHEPCLRASEEWDKVKGKTSVYGEEWNYAVNKQGLLAYWADGLKRSGKYENVITVGMRGERDSSMLPAESTLEENINLLKDIICHQKKLIQKYVNPDLGQVPMLLALYKEVEAYYYGDESTPGLKDWDGLDGITLMFCEDNYGNMRTLPSRDMTGRKGGFGMYYHLDYHGGPISYEWVNSTPLEKIWEQMCEAYEYGVRELWMVNVGDIKPLELPLFYYMDLAYDFEQYGSKAVNKTSAYVDEFVKLHFGQMKEAADRDKTAYVLQEYVRINGMRRPEAMNGKVYHPVHYHETQDMLERVDRLQKTCDELLSQCPVECSDAFFQLVYFPAYASANLQKMQLSAGLYQYEASHGSAKAALYAGQVERCIRLDRELQEQYHGIANGKWNHMMSSKHVGFTNWNEEGSGYPVCGQVAPEEEREVQEAFCLQIHASDYIENHGKGGCRYTILRHYGRTKDSIKVLPSTKAYSSQQARHLQAPYVVYAFHVPEDGVYVCRLWVAPSNPLYPGDKQRIGIACGDHVTVVSTLPDGFDAGNCHNAQWNQGVLDNGRYCEVAFPLREGGNQMKIVSVDAGVVLQSIVIYKEEYGIQPSYLI